MSIGSRLEEERNRLGYTQEEFAKAGGATRKSQFNYETNERKPKSDYLSDIAKIGADVQYILTGNKHHQLNAQEQKLLNLWRTASAKAQKNALAALLGDDDEPVLQSGFVQTYNGENISIENQQNNNVRDVQVGDGGSISIGGNNTKK